MKKKLLLLTGMICLVMSLKAQESAPSTNYTPRPYLGLQVGSLGAGLQFSYPFHDKIALRLSGTFLPEIGVNIKSTSGESDVNSNYRFKTGSFAIIADYSFLQSKPGIKLAFGAVYNMTSISGTNSYYLASHDEDLGELTLKLEPSQKINPYLGFVLGNEGKAKKISFAFELGLMYQGKPEATLTGEGRISPTASRSNEEIIENNVKAYQFYPYANFQLNFFLTKK